MSKISWRKVAIFFIVSMVCGFGATAHAKQIFKGSDYFETNSGYLTVPGADVNPVAIKGLPINPNPCPIGPGETDTIISRQDRTYALIENDPLTSETIPIEVVDLSLISVDPVTFGGPGFDMYVSLAPSTISSGKMTLSHNFIDNGTIDPEGAFTSYFTLNYKADFRLAPSTLQDLIIFSVIDSKLFDNSGAQWSHEINTDCLITGTSGTTCPPTDEDISANDHSPNLICPTYDDFFPYGLVSHLGAGSALHIVKVTLVELSAFTATGYPGGVLLEWTTESEVDNEGFNLWRAEADGGVYVKINNALIPAEGDGTTPHTYTYLDEDVETGATYYYKLEDIDTHGLSTFHGPIEVKWECLMLLEPEDGIRLHPRTKPVFEWDNGVCTPLTIEFAGNPEFNGSAAVDLRADQTIWTPKGRTWGRIRRKFKRGKILYWRLHGLDHNGEPVMTDAYSFRLRPHNHADLSLEDNPSSAGIMDTLGEFLTAWLRF